MVCLGVLVFCCAAYAFVWFCLFGFDRGDGVGVGVLVVWFLRGWERSFVTVLRFSHCFAGAGEGRQSECVWEL